jgi:hypothetical protein
VSKYFREEAEPYVKAGGTDPVDSDNLSVSAQRCPDLLYEHTRPAPVGTEKPQVPDAYQEDTRQDFSNYGPNHVHNTFDAQLLESRCKFCGLRWLSRGLP